MKDVNEKNFISMLSEDKPVMVLFTSKEKEKACEKVRKIMAEVLVDLPLLPAYEFNVDESENTKTLAEHLEVGETPVMVFFKAGNFHRYKDKGFTKASILKFIGNTKIYENKNDKKLSM